MVDPITLTRVQGRYLGLYVASIDGAASVDLHRGAERGVTSLSSTTPASRSQANRWARTTTWRPRSAAARTSGALAARRTPHQRSSSAIMSTVVSADRPALVIEGAACSDFEGFQREFSALLDDYSWHGNLDAFNDILRGGFGTPESGWVLRWLNSDLSRRALGCEATVERLEVLVTTCHPSNIDHIRQRIDMARAGEGPTLFDEIVEIIRVHGPGGEEQEDGVVLELL